MDVVLDVSVVPLSEQQIQAILTAHDALIGEDITGDVREPISVMTSVAWGEEKRFILPGNTDEFKEYKSAQEMIQDQVPLPDPIFMPGDVVPCTYDAGAQLNCLERHDEGFKQMIQEMFESGPELKLTKEGMEELLQQR
jgi:hypothetical protein